MKVTTNRALERSALAQAAELARRSRAAPLRRPGLLVALLAATLGLGLSVQTPARAADMAQDLRVGHTVKTMVVPGSTLCPNPDGPCGDNRHVDVQLWYPADISGFAHAPKTVYTSALHGQPLIPGRWDPLSWQVESEVAREAPIDPHGPAFPVIVFSHGSTNDPIDYAHTLERIAGAGFVVAAPSHVNNTQDDERIDFINTQGAKLDPPVRFFNCRDGRPSPCSRTNIPRSMEDRVRDISHTLVMLPHSFFGTVLKRVGNDGPHFTQFLAPKWLEKHEPKVDDRLDHPPRGSLRGRRCHLPARPSRRLRRLGLGAGAYRGIVSPSSRGRWEAVQGTSAPSPAAYRQRTGLSGSRPKRSDNRETDEPPSQRGPMTAVRRAAARRLISAFAGFPLRSKELSEASYNCFARERKSPGPTLERRCRSPRMRKSSSRRRRGHRDSRPNSSVGRAEILFRLGRDAQLRRDRPRTSPQPGSASGTRPGRPLALADRRICAIPTAGTGRSEPADLTAECLVTARGTAALRSDRGCPTCAYARPLSSTAATAVDLAAHRPQAAER
jgi:hypothetical protein